eukprot:1358258-Rhodomonas_salina.1
MEEDQGGWRRRRGGKEGEDKREESHVSVGCGVPCVKEEMVSCDRSVLGAVYRARVQGQKLRPARTVQPCTKLEHSRTCTRQPGSRKCQNDAE